MALSRWAQARRFRVRDPLPAPLYIWLALRGARDMYALKKGALAPGEDEELADHLQKWTEETVRMLERGRDEGLWQAIWGNQAA